MRNNNVPIAVEGLPFVAGAALISAIFIIIGWKVGAAFFIVVTVFIIFFFRNPKRVTPANEKAVVSPADGVVIYLGPAREPHLDQDMMKISIFMSVFNVHINRVPISARVVDQFYRPGKFLDVRHESATFENEQKGLVLETANGIRLVVVQVAGLIARRIVCYPTIGTMLRRGERYGLIRFGSRLDVYLPLDTELQVTMGDQTVAGETILGVTT
ncbi:phosphatidylserine decarboxylase, putative [Geotalea daltonii FRC-32]|uniref:Phosphatidylserine decarboxylase proenzyme n=1 Tax=Geotalea daltonii (strain DSM 22248 / JCM 15807 / FRC-32) TaxID=316067 RepID=PSD_GEODF|nr:phosphatidylserine decarboxylase family protein [Geotalea daltonii]B9M5B0.1 RecName: Full=Phosphatidylserine decarboxylase proenzyme; Contains: RecName: Full=Phosphatidylserine decarboxylase alpha chain; Contains: RecName: Full=Phosphatidylserine decarboxylase beta chain [Geotalea daltonii FRC-32]ACM19865.1 phosphatidylserine decarboxylase, putative [Geotalea daltonii FRC-32]